MVLENGKLETIPHWSIEIISGDLFARLRIKTKETSSDNGKSYKAGEEREVVGRATRLAESELA